MKKILLVDDDTLSVEFMRIFMESEGFTVHSASSCTEAKDLLEQHQPEIVITDVQLPDGSGVDLAKVARDTPGRRIIGVTGHSKDQLRESGNDVTVFDVLLAKPVELERLLVAVTG